MQDATDGRLGRSSRATPTGTVPTAAEALQDQRALQILSTEHWGLLSERSLVYNESFTRAGMFLTFLSMSFVALALLAQAIGFTGDYLAIAAIVLAFNLFIGLTTFARIMVTWLIDGRTIQGMNRLRHGYLEIAPPVAPYLITGVHDDEPGVQVTYGIASGGTSGLAGFAYGLSTALGMVATIVALLAGALAALLSMAAGASLWLAVGAGGLAAIVVFALELAWAGRVLRFSPVVPRFPTPTAEKAIES